MQFINSSGKLLPWRTPCIPSTDQSYRYGNGLFETLKLENGKIRNAALHFERLFHGLAILKFRMPATFTAENLTREMLVLWGKNNCPELARIRLSVSAGSGGLYDNDENLQYIIECQPLPTRANELNEKGLILDLFTTASKSCDIFSNLKTASHLPYVMAARFAKENNLDDCLLLNIHQRICDSTVANIFWRKDQNIFTPPLTEGCIAGVMRKYLLVELRVRGHNVHEKICSVPDLEQADEVFVTNAIKGINWVKSFRSTEYGNSLTREIYRACFLPE